MGGGASVMVTVDQIGIKCAMFAKIRTEVSKITKISQISQICTNCTYFTFIMSTIITIARWHNLS